jgi:hypothetical protein
VMPMPGVWFACALAAATPASQTIADKMHVPRIKVGLSRSMPFDTVKANRPPISATGAGGVCSAHLQTRFGLAGSRTPIGGARDWLANADSTFVLITGFLRCGAIQYPVGWRNLTKISHFGLRLYASRQVVAGGPIGSERRMPPRWSS